jgi:hypothetical protein
MPPKPLGADYVNNCLVSAGFTWCEILNKCVRLWEEMCEYPSNCLTWNDGCNMCELVEGELGMELGGCTEMYCFTRNMPFCQVYSPEVPNIMPVIDPLPPVINPFLGDGH